MTIILSRRIGGMNFSFMFSPADSETGILFSPEIMDRGNFLEVLQHARKLYPVMQALASTYNRYDVERPQHADIESLVELKSNTELVMSWSRVHITPDEIDHVMKVNMIVSEELERRRLHAEKKAAKKKSSVSDTWGYVYLLQSPTSAYKIGRTNNPKSRRRTFGVKLPFEVEYIVVIETDNMFELERTLHARFDDKRVNGEWFDLSADDVEYIKSLAVRP